MTFRISNHYISGEIDAQIPEKLLEINHSVQLNNSFIHRKGGIFLMIVTDKIFFFFFLTKRPDNHMIHPKQ